jgi:hypothetical protein
LQAKCIAERPLNEQANQDSATASLTTESGLRRRS